MSTPVIISIANDFSRFPAGRYSSDGPYSGEDFRVSVLKPHLDKGETIVIDFDGALGYGSSFLEEAFGGLVRTGYAAADLLKRLVFRSRDATLTAEVERYIKRAAAAE